MPRQSVEVLGRDDFQLDCYFYPETLGGIPLAGMGSNRLQIPCIFLPDGFDGPPPGYPWIYLGRMNLEPSASDSSFLSGDLSRSDSMSVQQRHVSAGATPDVQSSAGPIDRSSLPAVPKPAITAHPLTDLRSTLAALDALTGSNPIVQSMARPIYGADSSALESRSQPVDGPVQQEPLPPPRFCAAVNARHDERY